MDFLSLRSQLAVVALFLVLLPVPARGQNWDALPVNVTALRGGVHLVVAGGVNIAAFVGDDGVVVVDAGYAELADRVLATLRRTAEGAGAAPQIRYLVNTHWHFDHVGGNEAFAKAGATVLAHEWVARGVGEVRVLAALDSQVIAPLPQSARPALSFNDRVSLNWNGNLVHVIHMPWAHSDGDAIIHFRDADVVHLGDIFFNGLYPYIDVDFGGSLEGMVHALDDVLAHSGPETLFIPGHGPVATREDLERYTAMLRTVAGRIRAMVDRGLSRDEVVAAKPTAEFDAAWARPEGFAHPDAWVGLVYDGMRPQTGTVRDFEGHEYRTVRVGHQWWMAENLRTSHAADGTPLAGVFAYADDDGHVAACGRLYDHQAALRAAPPGWRLPTEDDWSVLERTLGDRAGIVLRQGGGSGFEATYCGYRNRLGDFERMGEWGSFRSSTLFTSDHGHIRNVTVGETTLNHWGASIHAALSVRYVKDGR